MSDRTAASLAKLDDLLTRLKALPPTADQSRLIEEAEHLRRAVDAFHMEAIRFRMYSVDRLLKTAQVPEVVQTFEELRHALEASGFHTRSHSAP